MTPRERLLVWTVGPIVAIVGGGFLLYFCVLKPMADGEARVNAATAELDEARSKLAEENRAEKRITELDPRLREWRRLSVPESPDKDILAHNTRMQDEYGRLINKLCKDAGLTVTVVPKAGDPDSKSAPILVNKTAVYTRFSFPFEAEGSYDSFVKMLEQFQRVPLLHKVSKMEITKLATPGGAAPIRGAVPARPARGASMLKLVLTLELLQVNGAEKRYTLLPHSLNSGMAFGAAQAVLYTPPTTGHLPRLFAEPDRVYSDMFAKNIFFGQTVLSDAVTSDHFEALRFHKLVCIKRTGFLRAEGMMYDQRTAMPNDANRVDPLDKRNDGRYIFLRATKVVDFTIQDDHNNEILAIRVLEITPDEVLFKVVSPSVAAKRITEKRAFPQNKSLTTDRPLISEDPEQVYRMRVGDFLTDALASRFQPPRTDSAKTEKTEKVEKIEKKVD